MTQKIAVIIGIIGQDAACLTELLLSKCYFMVLIAEQVQKICGKFKR